VANGEKKIVRDEELLLDSVYTNLLHISTVIRKTEEPDGELVDAFDSLLSTYLTRTDELEERKNG
jgi:hypothetical protein